MKNKEAQALYQTARRELARITGFYFTMAVNDAYDILEKERKVLEAMHEPDDDYKEYQKAVNEINKEYARKDESGNPVIITSELPTGEKVQYYDLDSAKSKEREKEIEKLQTKYKEAIKVQEEKEKAYNEAMEQESTFKPIPLDFDNWPRNMDNEQTFIARRLLVFKRNSKTKKK